MVSILPMLQSCLQVALLSLSTWTSVRITKDRWKGIGVLKGMVVVFTETNSDTIRVISLRKANSQEKKSYEKEIENRSGAR